MIRVVLPHHLRTLAHVGNEVALDVTGAVTQRALMQTTSVVCPSCGTVIDVSNDNLTVLSKYAEKTKVRPDIPIGSRGTFPDGTFERLDARPRHGARFFARRCAGGSV